MDYEPIIASVSVRKKRSFSCAAHDRARISSLSHAGCQRLKDPHEVGRSSTIPMPCLRSGRPNASGEPTGKAAGTGRPDHHALARTGCCTKSQRQGKCPRSNERSHSSLSREGGQAVLPQQGPEGSCASRTSISQEETNVLPIALPCREWLGMQCHP